MLKPIKTLSNKRSNDGVLVFCFPCTSDGKGNYSIVQSVKWSDFAREKIQITQKELNEEKAVVADLLRRDFLNPRSLEDSGI
jgi:hypothetical protein